MGGDSTKSRINSYCEHTLPLEGGPARGENFSGLSEGLHDQATK